MSEWISPFGEKLILMIVGAGLTGWLVPVIKTRLDESSNTRRLLLEADLARQKELIEAQIKLLGEFSDLGWRLLFGAFRVTYTHAWEDAAAQELAAAAYTPLSWEAITSIRATVSKASRLVSAPSLGHLRQTYEWCLAFDDDVSDMLDRGANRESWEQFHHAKFPEAAEVMDAAITALARELKLTAPTVTHTAAA